MTPGSVHPFRPSGTYPSQRARCADCPLGADQHDAVTLLAASIDTTAHRTAPKRLGRPPGSGTRTRAERICYGLPVCITPKCHRAPRPGRNGKCLDRCPPCAARHARPKTAIGPTVYFGFKVPIVMLGRVHVVADDARVTVAEWVRRAIGEALERQTPASNGS